MSDILKSVKTGLSRYAKSRQSAEVLTLALLTQQSILLHGKGGYAKTEMINSFMRMFDLKSAMFECTTDTTVSDLFGGAIARTDVQKKVDTSEVHLTREDINWERGPLAHDLFFFEEVLDADPRVLAALKSLMTSREFLGVKSQHQIFLGATNVRPGELVGEVPFSQANSICAFLDRWLVVPHGWESHEPDDYLNVLKSLSRPLEPQTLISLDQLKEEREYLQEVVSMSAACDASLAQLLSNSERDGFVVSPRTFLMMRKMMKAKAFVEGLDEVNDSHFEVLSLFPSMSPDILSGIQDKLEFQRECAVQKEAVEGFLARYQEIVDLSRSMDQSPTLYLSQVAHLGELSDEISFFSFSETFSTEKENLMKRIDGKVAWCQVKAQECIQVLPLPSDDNETI
jgi:MoxR-like ATPase